MNIQECTEGLTPGMKADGSSVGADRVRAAIGVPVMLRSDGDRTGLQAGRHQRSGAPAADLAQRRRPVQERISAGASNTGRGSRQAGRACA